MFAQATCFAQQAEYALKNYITSNKDKIYDLSGFSSSELEVSSCGTSVRPQPLHKPVVDEFKKKGIDIFNHMYMEVDERLVDEYDLIVSMGKDHQEYLKKNFNVKSPLFNEICHAKNEGILDDWEALGKAPKNLKKEEKYLRNVVNYIVDSMPYFVKSFKHFL